MKFINEDINIILYEGNIMRNLIRIDISMKIGWVLLKLLSLLSLLNNFTICHRVHFQTNFIICI